MEAVAFVGSKEFEKITPCPDTVVIDLTARANGTIDNTKWKDYLLCKFDVLSDRGEFEPIDVQAKQLAIRIYPFIKEAKKVICKCGYGEIRSVAVARGIAYSDVCQLPVQTIVKGKWVKPESNSGSSSTFSGRTTRWIASNLDDLREFEVAPSGLTSLHCIQILDRIQVMVKRPKTILFVNTRNLKLNRSNDKKKLWLLGCEYAKTVLTGIDVPLERSELRDGQTIQEFVKENDIKDALIVKDDSTESIRYISETNNVETITLYEEV